MRKYGSRQDVFEGVCQMTRGGLTKDDLIFKNGKLVSKKKSEAAKKAYEKYGFAKRKQPEPEPEAPPAPKKKRRKRKSKKSDE